MQPSAKTVEAIGKLGLRYPPASSVDREAHAARIALLAEDCADLDPEWIDEAAREWAKAEPFLPRACELRDRALEIGRRRMRGRLLPRPVPKARPPEPPLTDEEIARLSPELVAIGLKLGALEVNSDGRMRAAGE